MNFEIKEVYHGVTAVFDHNGVCMGVLVKSVVFPWKYAFFSYDDATIYHGMTAEEAVVKSFEG